MIVGGSMGGSSVQLARRTLAWILLAVVVIAAAAGWFASAFVRSPADAAARTAPPVASPILVPVESRVLAASVITRGTARFGSPQQLTIAPTALSNYPLVVAETPPLGAELSEGDVVLTASGRPAFLLEGVQPAFRDLGPGMEGLDVLQLEQALARLGFDPGEIDGTYDSATEAGVAAWYESAGFQPMTATTEQLAAIRALEAELTAARLDIISARDAVSATDAGVVAARATYDTAMASALHSPTALAMAVELADAANRAAAAEVATRSAIVLAMSAPPKTVPATPAEIAAAEADLTNAISNQQLVQLTGQQAVAEAVAGGDPTAIAAAQALAAAADAAAAAEVGAKQKTLDAVKAGTPGTPPTAAELAAANADLAAAQTNMETTRLLGEQAIADAQAAATNARADATSAGAALRAAEDALANARSAVGVRGVPLSSLELEYSLQQRRAGIQVPASEIIFVPVAPVRVATVAVRRGDEVNGAVMTVTDAVVAIDGGLPLDAAALVTPGMPVTIDEPSLGIEETGVVSKVANGPGTNGVDGFHVYFEVLVDGSPERLVGASVRLTVPVESTGEEALTVPVSALSLAPDGSSRVQVHRDTGNEYVTVSAGLSASGFVAVTPIDGSLQAGDQVIIGFDTTGAASSATAEGTPATP